MGDVPIRSLICARRSWKHEVVRAFPSRSRRVVVRTCASRPRNIMPKTKHKGPSVFCACAPAIRQIHWSVNYLGRRGCKLRFGDVDVETFVLPGCVSMKPYGTKVRRKSGPAPRISSLQLICAQADALRNAKALAYEVGCSDLVEFGFHVV